MAQYPLQGFVEVPDGPVTGTPDEVRAFKPILGGADGEAGQQYRYQQAYGYRNGRFVHLQMYLQLAAKGTIRGELRVKGFPWPLRFVPGWVTGVVGYYSNLAPSVANVTNLTLLSNGGLTSAQIYGFIPGLNPRQLTFDDINDHTQFACSIDYLLD